MNLKTHKLRPARMIQGLIAALMLVSLGLPAAATAAPLQGKGYLPTTLKYGCQAQRQPSVFGVQAYGSLTGASPYFIPFQNSGASWVRVSVPWQSIEPSNTSPSEFKWGTADSALRVANVGCANVLATINTAPEWAVALDGNPEGPIDTAEMSSFVQFVTALVERYDGDGVSDTPDGMVVNYWEFYNEPDLGPTPTGGTGWGNHAVQYANMLKAVYAPIKQANPNAKVVLGGIAYDNFVEKGGPFVSSFLDNVLKAGGGAYFDIMNFHFYPAFSVEWTQNQGTGLAEKTAAIRQKLADHGLDKPVIVTEAGWHNATDTTGFPSSDEIQSQYVVRFFTQSKALGLQFTIWWLLHDLPSIHEIDGYQYSNGLVTYHNPPEQPMAYKPAYKVYQTAAARLARAEFAGTLSAGETQAADLEAHRFTESGSRKSMVVAWVNPVDSSQTRPLRLAGGSATVYSKDNTNLGVVQDGDDGVQDGQITVQVGSSPVYIVLN